MSEHTISNIYKQPSSALLPLDATNNVDFTYASTAIETWLVDHSLMKMKETAAVMLTLPDVTASYWHDGNRYGLFGTNFMTKSERNWWKKHGQALVDTSRANGPDVIGLLHDKVSYGAYGDHGGAQESVQGVPMVFWSQGLSAGSAPAVPFTTPDVLPTILRAMGILISAPSTGGRGAWPESSLPIRLEGSIAPYRFATAGSRACRSGRRPGSRTSGSLEPG